MVRSSWAAGTGRSGRGGCPDTSPGQGVATAGVWRTRIASGLPDADDVQDPPLSRLGLWAVPVSAPVSVSCAGVCGRVGAID